MCAHDPIFRLAWVRSAVSLPASETQSSEGLMCLYNPSPSSFLEGRLESAGFPLSVMIQTAHHSRGEHIGLIFRIRPKHIMPHLMINGADPASFRVILSASLPILRVDEINLAVFVGLSGSSTPIDILEPLNFGISKMIETAERRDGFPKIDCPVLLKKRR